MQVERTVQGGVNTLESLRHVGTGIPSPPTPPPHHTHTLAPSMMVAPMPITQQSSIVAAWMVAPGPIVTLLPMTVGRACSGGEGGAAEQL